MMKALILSLALLAGLGTAPMAGRDMATTQVDENTWQGALVDWDCKQLHVDEVCPAGPTSQRFALSVDGGVLLYLDERGNELARQALRKAHAGGNVEAVVLGEREGRLLKVQSIRIGAIEIS